MCKTSKPKLFLKFKGMRIVCMTNEGQLPMMKNMLNSARNVGIPMELFHCYILTTNKEAATYSTHEFKHITTRKLQVIQMNMAMDNTFWVDNDIVFFENCIADVTSNPGSFVMQDDGWALCTGFFYARPNLFSKQVLSHALSWINRNPDLVPNDQHAFNAVLKNNPVVIHKLSKEEYPNGDVYFNEGTTSKARMVHSNFLKTTAEKVQRFKDHKMWNESDVAFNLVRKYYI